MYSRFGEWKFCNNSIHFLANHNLVANKVFRKGLLKSYRMVYFRLDEAVRRKAEIENFCACNAGSPQPYWA